MQAQPIRSQTAQTETRIFTVYQDDANDEIRFRQAFGWILQSTTARSYNSGGNLVGGGFGDGVSVGAAHIAFSTQHKTDLVMIRRLDARGQKLRQLEQQYEAVPLGDPKVSMLLAIGIAFLVFVGGAMLIGPLSALPQPTGAMIALVIMFGIPPVIYFVQRGKRNRRIKILEARRAETRRAIHMQAQRISGVA